MLSYHDATLLWSITGYPDRALGYLDKTDSLDSGVLRRSGDVA